MQHLPYWPIDAQPALQAAARSSARVFVSRRVKQSPAQTSDASRCMNARHKNADLLRNYEWVLPAAFKYNVCMGEAAGQPAAAAACQLFRGACTC